MKRNPVTVSEEFSRFTESGIASVMLFLGLVNEKRPASTSFVFLRSTWPDCPSLFSSIMA